jgi:glucosamine--fructose-6-phosphate aminotransferase (isomerizing)
MGQGTYSWNEIVSQGESWAGALRAVGAQRAALIQWLAGARARGLIFIGCGSTHYLSIFAANWFQERTGWRCRGLPSSELLWQGDAWLTPGERPAIVALSRSGETSETILTVEHLAQLGCPTLTIGCYADTPLARAAGVTVAIPEGQEESYAQTRSFAGMLVAVQALGALASGDLRLPAELEALPTQAASIISRSMPLAQAYGADETIKRITYLGSGPFYGLANEATVKMKEMSLSLAEAYQFMEFRHGPMSLVDCEHLIVALISDAMRGYEIGVLADLKARGARVLAIANGTAGLAAVADDCFDLQTGSPSRARSVLYLPMLQLLAYYRAMGRGLNPDRPRNVVMAIRLEGTGMAADAR